MIAVHKIGPGGGALRGVAEEVVLRPRGAWRGIAWGELWRHRELLWLLAWRDVKVRYKQTVLGALWAVLQPLGLMAVIAVFLGRYTGLSDPVALYAGLVPWTFFAAAVSGAAGSVVNHQHMIQKVYFPRLLIPIAAVGAPLMDYLLATGVMFGLMGWQGLAPGWSMLWLPLFAGSMVVAALGVGVGLAAVCVWYRDMRHVTPFLLQVMFFASGIIVIIESAAWGWLLPINPMYGVVGAMRSAVLGQSIDFAAWGISTLTAALLLVVGAMYFQNREQRFADLI